MFGSLTNADADIAPPHRSPRRTRCSRAPHRPRRSRASRRPRRSRSRRPRRRSRRLPLPSLHPPSADVDPYAQYVVPPSTRFTKAAPWFNKTNGKYYSYHSPPAVAARERRTEMWKEVARRSCGHLPKTRPFPHFVGCWPTWWSDRLQQKSESSVCASASLEELYSDLEGSLPPVVMDPGSGYTKVGYAGQTFPSNIFASLVGRPKGPGIMVGLDAKDCWVGSEAMARRGILKLKYPIEHGFVTNWNDVEKIWHHAFFNELGIEHETETAYWGWRQAKHPVVMLSQQGSPDTNLQKRCAILMETFDVPALRLAVDSRMALFSSGRLSGTVVNSGDGQTRVLCFEDGVVLRSPASRREEMRIAGRDVTEYLVKILCERGYELVTSAERVFVAEIKEKFCRVSLDYEMDLTRGETGQLETQSFELPDGSVVEFCSEMFRAPEILFKPAFIGSETAGLTQQIRSQLQDAKKFLVSPETERELKVLTFGGGSTLIPGLTERILSELPGTSCTDQAGVLSQSTKNRRRYASWIGASVVSSLSSFDEAWIAKSEYDDAGAGFVRRKLGADGWRRVCNGISEIVECYGDNSGEDIVAMSERLGYATSEAFEKTYGVCCVALVRCGGSFSRVFRCFVLELK